MLLSNKRAVIEKSKVGYLVTTYVAQHLPTEQLARFKSLDSQVVFGNPLLLTVDGLQHVAQVCSCQRRLRNNRLHLLLFCF